MPPTWQFQLPTRIEFGRGGRRKLGAIARRFGRSALVVGYADQTGVEEAYAKATDSLGREGIDAANFFEVTPDPTAELLIEGARRATEVGADVVVALGGGSVIDAAKGVAALARLGGCPWDYSVLNPQSRPITAALPIVAVPTTAGTGSEVTSVAVFTQRGIDSQPDLPLKATLLSPFLAPQVALIDPELTAGSPPRLTASCGADALGHAIEACLSRRANPFSTLLAQKAVALIFHNLRRAVAEPNAPEPREALALAALLAGAAFNEAGVVVTHALAHALGAVLGVSHSDAVAISTPLGLRYNAKTCATPFAELADLVLIGAKDREEKGQLFVDAVAELLRDVVLPDHVETPADAPADLVDRLVRNAVESSSSSITCNPRKVNEATLQDLFRQSLRSGRGVGKGT